MNRPLSPKWLYFFVVVQCFSVAALSIEALGSIRLPLRIVPFAMSIAYLLLLRPGGVYYPVRRWALAGLVVMSFGLFHPEANTMLSGVAQIALSVAVWGPVFWVGRIAITTHVFRRMLLILWAYNTLSSGLGVLQVYNPERFAPDPTFVKQLGLSGPDAVGLMIELDDGRKVFRPMGLSDTPGGAAIAANSAIVMGIVVAMLHKSILLKVLVVGASVLGMFCLYMCQVRSILILTAISVIFMLISLATRGRTMAATYITVVAFVGTVVGFMWATTLGEAVVTSRLESLVESSAGQVYYSNRGIFVEDTLQNLLPKYPLGAGLGRWGMMWTYFGDPTSLNSPPLWAEMTLTGWVYDGGLPLVLAGYGGMVVVLVIALRIAIWHPSDDLSVLAAMAAGISVAAFVTTISAHVFVTQSGMMYLLLNAMLYAAARYRPSVTK